MAIMPCPECGKEISNTVQACPHCGFVMKRKKSGNTGCLIFFIVFGLLVIIAGMAPESPYEKGSDTIGAVSWCQMHIERMLKSPDSAEFEFASSDRITKHLGDDVYMVESYVDAKNSFNASIRHDYKCKVERINKDLFNIIDVHIQSR